MYIVFLGAPGAGKGTQAEKIVKKLNVVQISTGAIFREEIEKKTPIGLKIQDVISKGDLVSDDLVFEVLENRLNLPDCNNGAIFDGIPRTIPQAEKLDSLLEKINKKLSNVIYIELSREEITKRLSGRWTCKATGHVFHEIYNPPKIKGICDVDYSELYQRDDQKPEIITERIVQYEKSTFPLVDYYNKKGILHKINGDQSIEKVGEDIEKIL